MGSGARAPGVRKEHHEGYPDHEDQGETAHNARKSRDRMRDQKRRRRQSRPTL